jgi:hypothetical protein
MVFGTYGFDVTNPHSSPLIIIINNIIQFLLLGVPHYNQY